MKLEDDSEVMVVEEKPGAKLQKFRDELQSQIAQKRSELWQKKATKQISKEETNLDCREKDDCELDDDILDDEEEEVEIMETSEEEEEEENEEIDNDVNREKKSIFIDEEAEESEGEGDEIIEPSEDGEANEADDENEIDDLSSCDEKDEVEQTSQSIKEFKVQPTNKIFRKILKGFTEDSDEEESVSQTEDIRSNKENSNTFSGK